MMTVNNFEPKHGCEMPGTCRDSQACIGDCERIEIPDLLNSLRTAAVVIWILPEDPGYNGSRLIIDDIEADEIGKTIDAAIAEVEGLRNVLRLALDAMIEADAHFSETSEKCMGLVHALPKVREALGHN